MGREAEQEAGKGALAAEVGGGRKEKNGERKEREGGASSS